MVDTVIEFGGFYGSIHESIIESKIESYLTLDSGELAPEYEEVNWRANFNEYIKFYTLEFENWLLSEYGLNVTFSNIELKSPREYNFRTDTIEAAISENAEKALIDYFKNNTDFLNYLFDATQDSSGYFSFYSYREVLRENKDNVFTIYLFRYLAEIFNENDFLNAVDYYDSVILPEYEAA